MADTSIEDFGELRAVLHGAQTPGGFARVLGVLRGGFERDEQIARDVWLPYALDALRAWPDAARTLDMGKSSVDLDAPGEAPWLALTRGLKVDMPGDVKDRRRRTEWSARAVDWIARTPELAGLRRLDLSRQRLTPEGAKVVARAEHLGGLVDLDVSGTRSQSLGLQALMRAPLGANLRRLVASSSRVSVAGFEAVAKSTRRLVELDLSNNPARGGLGHIARSEHMGALARLDVSATQPDASDLQALTDSDGLGALRILNLSGSRFLHDEGMTEFARAEWLPQLDEFVCQRCGWGERGLSIWLEAAERMDPRVLELDGARVQDDALDVFADARLDALRELDLRVVETTPEQSRVLCQAGWISRLDRLSLSGVKVDEASSVALVERIVGGRLERLDLWASDVEDTQAAALLAACAQAKVRELSLGGGALGVASTKRLAALDLSGLRSLNLRTMRLSSSFVRTLAASESLSGLDELRLSDELTREDREGLAKSKTLPASIRRQYRV